MLEKIQTCSCKCNCAAVFEKDGNQSLTPVQDPNTRIKRKNVILSWVIWAITLTALSHFQVPHNTEGSDMVTIVQTSWKIEVLEKKGEAGWDFFPYFDIFLPWRLHTKGSFWSLECWAHTCGMNSKPSVNYIKYALPNCAHTSMCFYQAWKGPFGFTLQLKKTLV